MKVRLAVAGSAALAAALTGGAPAVTAASTLIGSAPVAAAPVAAAPVAAAPAAVAPAAAPAAVAAPTAPTAAAAPAARGKLTHREARKLLTAAGIDVHSSGGCSDRSRTDCTSLAGIRAGTVLGLIDFQADSGCVVDVTGGTEAGHATRGRFTHANGYKIDIRVTQCVADHVERTFAPTAARSNGDPQWRSAEGDIYALEHARPHWDIAYLAGR